jgi:hypothetical protein
MDEKEVLLEQVEKNLEEAQEVTNDAQLGIRLGKAFGIIYALNECGYLTEEETLTYLNRINGVSALFLCGVLNAQPDYAAV